MSAGVELEIKVALEEFRFNEGELMVQLRNPIGRDLARRAIQVEASAKQHATGRPGPEVQTGRLRGSITWRLGFELGMPYADIGTSVVYAPYVELGTSRAPAYPFLRPALEAARL